MPIIGPKYDEPASSDRPLGKKSQKSLKLKLAYGRDMGND